MKNNAIYYLKKNKTRKQVNKNNTKHRKQLHRKQVNRNNKKHRKQVNRKNLKSYNIFSSIMKKIGFIHIHKDKDGLYDGLVVPKTHANYLFYTSFFSMLSSIFLFYRKNDNYIYTFAIFITSINYWRNPIYNWRRTIDILVTFLSFFWVATKFYIQSKIIDVLPTIIISFLFYVLSYYFQEKSIHISTFCHSLIHIYPNIKFIIYELNEG
uniref:Uncharacterized protein n=1 Tax=viral metagenome TaxID=1070528 RepID=A0A6C0IGA1_9ZZZZ